MIQLSDITVDKKTLLSKIIKSNTSPFTIWCEHKISKPNYNSININHSFYKITNMDYIYQVLFNKFGNDITQHILFHFIEIINPNNCLSLNSIFCHYNSSKISYNDKTHSYQSSMSINTKGPYQCYMLDQWKYLLLFHQACIDITNKVTYNLNKLYSENI